MGSISHHLSLFIRCSSSNQEHRKHKLHSLKLHETSKREQLIQNHGTAEKDISNHNRRISNIIPTTNHLLGLYLQGKIIQGSMEFRQTVVIRSNDVAPDKTATVESILYLLQETSLNHMWMSGFQDDGFGTTAGMMRNNLIWVISRMRLQVDQYPIWRDVMEIDMLVGASGKNGIQRDWILRNQATGLVYARATSTWAMINKQTRRLSKMPDEVRAEMSPLFSEKQAIEKARPEKIEKLDKALHVNSDLKAKRSDLDMNHHVNNVKYVRWMLETIPDEFLESHWLSDILLEYRKECEISDVVQSLCEPAVNGNLNEASKSYTHLLQKTGHEPKIEEMVRGKTTWKRQIQMVNYNNCP